MLNFQKINTLKLFKYHGKKSVLFNKIFGFKYIKTSSISHRNLNAFLLWYSKWFYLLCSSVVSYYARLVNANRLILLSSTLPENFINSNFCNVYPKSFYNSSVEIQMNSLKFALIFLTKFIYSESSLYITNSKKRSLITILKSPHTDKKARNQYYRFSFNRTVKYSNLLSSSFFKLFKKLFKHNPFYWFVFAHCQLKCK